MPLIQERLAAGQTIRFYPQGISMLPMLRQGVDSVILAPPPQKLKKYDIPLYQRPGGKYILHRVVAVSEAYTCTGDNQFRQETGVEHSCVIAVVVAFYRGDTLWRTDDWRYRLYCRLWHGTRPLRHFCKRGIGWMRRRLKT